MTDWADKARVELDEFVGDLWAEDDEGGVKLYVGLDGEDAAEYIRANFIPRARVEKELLHHSRGLAALPASQERADHCSKRNVLADLLSEERT